LAGGRRGSWDPDAGRFGSLGASRRAVAEALAAAGGGDERLLGVGGEHLLRAQSANATLLGAPTVPAWRRYTGVVWEHLDPVTLDAAARRRIVVVSGLLGLVRGDDQVPDYRLRMAANLRPLGKLSTWWRDDLSATLDRAARRSFVIDLLPKEHRAAWRQSGVHGVRVELVDPSGKPGAHFAKAAKGRLARAVLSSDEPPLDVLRTWSDDRYLLDIQSV
jgi:cytoplasmic iron level regulating protein YaaA (DUF328/UPF0246 family)